MLKYLNFSLARKKNGTVSKNSIYVLNQTFKFKSSGSAVYLLSKVYGISFGLAFYITRKFGIESRTKFLDLSERGSKLMLLFLDFNFLRIDKLKSIEDRDLLRFQLFNNYKGVRHLHGLPVNGQQTRANAKSARSIVFHQRLLKIVSAYRTKKLVDAKRRSLKKAEAV